MSTAKLLIGAAAVALAGLASCGKEDAKPTARNPVPAPADGSPTPALSEGGAVIEEKLEDVEKCFHDRRALGGPLNCREHAVWREFATAVTSDVDGGGASANSMFRYRKAKGLWMPQFIESGDDYCVSAWTSYCQFVAKKK